MKEMHEIVGQMIVTNTDKLHDPHFNAYNSIFGAIMASNLIEMRILEDGIVELHEHMPAEKSRLTPLEFAESLKKFLAYEGINELGFEGEFIFIRTAAGKQPLMSEIVLKNGAITAYEAEIKWKANG